VIRLPERAIALTISVVSLLATAPARAADDLSSTTPPTADSASPNDALTPSSQPSTSPSSSSSPLQLRRDSAPLKLSDDPSPVGLGWKLAASALLLGGVVYVFRRRALVPPGANGLAIVQRTTIGLRTELIVVTMDGQRLLLGVTAHSIHTLAVLDSDDALPDASTAANETPRVGSQFDTLLDSIESKPSEPASRTPPTRPTDDAIPGQARGLTALRRKR